MSLKSRIKNLRQKNLKLNIKIWMYFMLFVCVVFVLMWGFQVLGMEWFYESFKIRDVSSIVEELTEEYGETDFEDFAGDISVKNDMCIEVVDAEGTEKYYSCFYNGKCLLHGEENGTYFYLLDLQNSSNGKMFQKAFNNDLQLNMLVYGQTLYDSDGSVKGYLLVNTPLVPVESTVSILKRQTEIITFILVMFGFVLSFYVSNHISRPITKITVAAQRLAHGDYSTDFEGGDYLEVDDLAETLNYTAQELSKTDAMQRDLIANVSHDLRTPLTMMKAYAEMIRDLSGNNPVKREKHLNVIIEETDRLSALVSDMLDLSKLESGTQELTYSTFNITDMLSEIAHRYEGISAYQGYTITFTPDEPVMVSCDEGKINRVVGNLINNAINYTSKEDKQVFLTQKNTAAGVRIEVRDTGDGIEQDKIGMIFDKYYRSENHKRETVGTGLGLSIVKAILKLHGYDYGVNSVLGEGSTFWFEIRKAEVPSQESKKA